MKFGKYIQSQQVPGWAPYYLDYKFLKKIINSSAANRPASEAATLALGIRPADLLSQPTPSAPYLDGAQGSDLQKDPGRPPLFSACGQDEDRGPDFQAHKAAFFFKLERELEKVNAFYLQKEAEQTLRLETLLSKRRSAALRGLPDAGDNSTRGHVEWSAVEEGFRVLERDLGKLQQYIEINATGFRKILKKWDKRSASKTKEIYLARQVDIQPVFNRQLISELSDTVTTCLLDLTDLSAGLKFEGRAAHDVFTQLIVNEGAVYTGPFRDLENNLRIAVSKSDEAAVGEILHYSQILAQQEGGRYNVTRILWKVITEAPDALADFILGSLATPFDFDFIDDINGRTCLHEAAIAENPRLVNLCIEQSVQVDKTDIYGRSALHYAAMKGHVDICQRLLEVKLSPHALDLDNYTPIVYAIMRGSLDCVRTLLDKGVTAQPPQPIDNLIPLSLASQWGHADVVMLLLQHGCQCQPNTNGEYPMHVAAREGHAEVCKILLGQDGWDVPDKYHEWTPLFHAARYGHASCIDVLLHAGCRVDLVDEFGHFAVHYAAWYGHHECVDLLLKASDTVTAAAYVQSQHEPSPMFQGTRGTELDIDLIPSLSLPPPIMPYRTYGHNYLDKVHLVQVAIGNSMSRYDKLSRRHSPGVRLHPPLISNSPKDNCLLASNTLKLVMTTSPDVNTAPYGISLPQREDEGVFSFQIASLDSLSLQFSIYPNFGTKTIGRATAIPSLFSSIQNSTAFVLPILDHRLHVIGEVSFEVNIIKPFDGVTLEVGGAVETYWKSTANVSPLFSPSRPPPFMGSTQTSPSNQSMSGSAGQALTVSSLSGDYIYAVIQVTRDFQPVVYPHWNLSDVGFDLGIADLTLAQFEGLAMRSGRHLDPSRLSLQDWSRAIPNCMMSLTQLLMNLPATTGACLELASPSQSISESYNLGRRLDLNIFVDSVLRTVNHTSAALARSAARRKIVFTSFSPDVCAALNWKQPNYPVFFGSNCGKPAAANIPSTTATSLCGSKDRRLSNLAAAVEFSKANNLLGVFVNADLLMPIPSLIQGIRAAGLIVSIYGSTSAGKLSINTETSPVDAILQDGVFTCTRHTLSELL